MCFIFSFWSLSFLPQWLTLSKCNPKAVIQNMPTSSFTVPNSGSRALKWYLKLPWRSTAALKSLRVTSPSLTAQHSPTVRWHHGTLICAETQTCTFPHNATAHRHTTHTPMTHMHAFNNLKIYMCTNIHINIQAARNHTTQRYTCNGYLQDPKRDSGFVPFGDGDQDRREWASSEVEDFSGDCGVQARATVGVSYIWKQKHIGRLTGYSVKTGLIDLICQLKNIHIVHIWK